MFHLNEAVESSFFEKKSFFLHFNEKICIFICMAIGVRIRSLRLKSGLTLPQLSEKAEVSIGLLSQLENSDTNSINPNLQTLRKIANTLGVTIADLLDKPVAVSRSIVPEKLDQGLADFLEKARKQGMEIDEAVVQGCYAMQERDGAPKTATDWEFLYKTIKMNFDARRKND
ncbi:transcriptional regulator with XRE-family HTH domain [Ereboglobus sp. PH5-5]|uniref:helix-turn-helix domain-containing protein n=1 Tax=Ereboglobus sp. PH5-5 TaxID=2940529 RepID=UPI00240671D9|nr:helix-turn-helix transcriptional regulator [Ereboglobus sp. PH5-5]MDF9832356.1 transcriptional regulator with XRE-family HTH domain [Ereboglobus sp. PH5-5]